MSCYVNSNDNRFYAALETVFGTAAAIISQNRFPADHLHPKQLTERVRRRDKTGTRTFQGLPNQLRSQTAFSLSTFLTSWDNQTAAPAYGPLFACALGNAGQIFAGGTIAAVSSGLAFTFTSAHGLSVGQAISLAGELRFVIAIVSTTEIEINAPFTGTVGAGQTVSPTITYSLAEDLPSATIYDYWSPSGVVQRMLVGAAVDRMRIRVNNDFHEFEFAGPAKDLLDSASFESGQGGLTQYPAEPSVAGFDYTIVPGHLGEVWLGTPASRFYTITEAELSLTNSVDMRAQEFGLQSPVCFSAGQRDVELSFELFEQDNTVTQALYQAARQRSPIPAMFQLGNQPGQMFGFYLNAVVPQVPEFDDREPRLQWKFTNDRAQGSVNDELFVAFG
jgi:hypothetical protein